MPKLTYSGAEAFGNTIDRLSNEIEGILKQAVYDGAHEVFAEVQRQLQALPTSDRKSKHKDPSPEQIQGLMSSLYGSRIMVRDGGVFENISFTGYNNVKTEQYPQGQPNIMIARSIESGATYMNKRPFISKAAKNARDRASGALERTFEREIEKITR